MSNKKATNKQDPGRRTIYLPVEASDESGLADVLKRTNAQNPSEEDKRALARAFEKHPHIWQMAGDLQASVRTRAISRLSLGNHLVQASIERKAQALEEEMGSENAPCLEQLLIQQIVDCWLNLSNVRLGYDNSMQGSVTLTAGAYWEKRLSSAQARFLRACETLAKVRRLSRAVPLQVNIGGQQINVAHGATEDR